MFVKSYHLYFAIGSLLLAISFGLFCIPLAAIMGKKSTTPSPSPPPVYSVYIPTEVMNTHCVVFSSYIKAVYMQSCTTATSQQPPSIPDWIRIVQNDIPSIEIYQPLTTLTSASNKCLKTCSGVMDIPVGINTSTQYQYCFEIPLAPTASQTGSSDDNDSSVLSMLQSSAIAGFVLMGVSILCVGTLWGAVYHVVTRARVIADTHNIGGPSTPASTPLQNKGKPFFSFSELVDFQQLLRNLCTFDTNSKHSGESPLLTNETPLGPPPGVNFLSNPTSPNDTNIGTPMSGRLLGNCRNTSAIEDNNVFAFMNDFDADADDGTDSNHAKKLFFVKGTILWLRAFRIRLHNTDTVRKWEVAMEKVLDSAQASKFNIVQVDFHQIILAFNISEDNQDHQMEGCKTAQRFQLLLEQNGILEGYGIAIASGQMMKGTWGVRQWNCLVGDLMEYTHQMLNLCELLNVRILITEETADNVGNLQGTQINLRIIDNVQFQSRYHLSNEPIYIYELLRSSTVPVANRMMFKSAFIAFCEGDLNNCETILGRYMEFHPNDVHAQRLRALLQRREDMDVVGMYYRLYVGWERLGVTDMGSVAPARPTSGGSVRGSISYNHADKLKEDMDRMMSRRGGAGRRVVPTTIVNRNSSISSQDGFEDVLHNNEELGGTSSTSNSDEPSTQLANGALPRTILDLDRRVWWCSTRPVGAGRTATVYVGMSDVGNLVALKVMKLDASLRDSLVREVELLSKLHHPNILPYISSAIVENNLVIITQYVSGGALDSMLDQFGPVSLATLRKFLRDIVRGIRYLHSRNVMHSDIKPANVLLDAEGVCKLSDFGTASHITNSTGLRGTPLYMAPEQARANPCTASDIWALGIMVLVLATGIVPYPDVNMENPFTFVLKMSQEKLTPVVPDQLDPDVKDFVRLCLVKDPAKRASADILNSHPLIM